METIERRSKGEIRQKGVRERYRDGEVREICR